MTAELADEEIIVAGTEHHGTENFYTVDGKHIARCRCAWVSTPCSSHKGAAMAIQRHIKAEWRRRPEGDQL